MAGAYLAQARRVLHLADGPQQAGRGGGRGGLQDATEAGAEERGLGHGGGRSVLPLLRGQIQLLGGSGGKMQNVNSKGKGRYHHRCASDFILSPLKDPLALAEV